MSICQVWANAGAAVTRTAMSTYTIRDIGLHYRRRHAKPRHCYTRRPRADTCTSPAGIPGSDRWRVASTCGRRWQAGHARPVGASRRSRDADLGFSDYITPIDQFFVRSHVYTPRVDISQWRLTVEGEVANALTLTLDDLRRLPSVELVSVLECAGNGRSFYEPSVPGLQWGHGAVGNARWRGVRLADVLKRAGPKASPNTSSSTAPTLRSARCPTSQRSIPSPRRLTRPRCWPTR